MTARPLLPTEGNSVTLSCDTQLPSDRSRTQLQYSFFREGHTLRSEWSSSEFWISALWKEDSGYYWCEAMTSSHSVSKRSHRSYIHVQSEHQWVGWLSSCCPQFWNSSSETQIAREENIYINLQSTRNFSEQFYI